MIFSVAAAGPAGERKVFRREAESASAAAGSVRSEGWLVLSVSREESAVGEKGADSLPWWHPSWILPPSGFDVEMGLRQLASMVKSGIALLLALRTTADQASRPRMARAWRSVADGVFSGQSFSDALRARRGVFGEITIRLAEVGERSGELEFALTRAADQLESRRNLRSSVINALVYPLIAVTMAIGVSAFLVVGVIPKISDFLASSGVELPSLTQALVDFSEWTMTHGWAIIAAVSGFFAAWMVLRLFSPTREAEDALLLRIPVTGRILRLSGTSLFARSMEIMLEAGVTLVNSLETSAALLQNRRLRRRAVEARGDVVKGESLSDALAKAREFMPMLHRMAAVGETSGALPESFGETARFHEMLLAMAVKRFGMVIEPAMIFITAGIVGFVYIAFFMALFAIAGAA